jgi:hemoglobin/transferrin/lactoferrin receptor protein
MNNIYTLILLIFTSLTAIGQKVVVYSTVDGQPIPEVVITTSKQKDFISCNAKGEADISRLKLKTESILIFKHNYYKETRISLSDLESHGYIVLMIPTTIELSEFSITANKWEQNRQEIPFEITEVKTKEIEFNNPQTSADIMSNTGKVFVQKSQMGGGSPMIRGFAANGVLIVVDGVRMNNAIFRGGNLQNIINIDPNAIGHTEVIFGPGSVTYGSDAMGGVMDFHTKKAEYAIDKKFDFNVELMGRASFANEEQTTSLGLNLGWKKFASRTQISFSKFGDLKAGKQHFGNYPEFGKRNYVVSQDANGKDQMYKFPDPYIMSPSAYSAFFLNQKFSLHTGKNSNLSYQFLYSTTTDIPRYDRLIQQKGNHLKYGEWYYGPQTWMMHNLKFNTYKKTKAYDQMVVILAYQQFNESRHDRKFQDSLLRHRDEKVNAYTLNIDFEKDLGTKLDLFYGFEAMYNDVISSAYGENIFSGEQSTIPTRYPNIYNHYFTSGIFVNLKYRISNKLTAMTGLRYSRVFSDSKFDNSKLQLPYDQITMNLGAPNGSIGLAWLPGKKWQLNFNIASAFRAPNIDDAAKVFDSEPGNVVVPNPDLQPEYAYSAELGINKDINDFAHLELNLFYTHVDQIIVRRDFQFNGNDSIVYDGTMSKVQAMVNSQSAQIYGATAAIQLKLSKAFSFESTYSITKGTDDEGYSLRHVAPSFGSSSIRYKYQGYQAQFYANYNGGIAFNDLAPSEQSKTHIYTPDGAEAWYTLNIKGSVKISLLTFDVGVENILDRFYMPYSSGIPGTGRNFYIALHLHY